MGMQATKALRSERRWQNERWAVVSPWGQGSAATCLMMEKGPYNSGWSVPRLMSEPRWSIPDRCSRSSWGFGKPGDGDQAKNHSKVMVLAALTNLFLGRKK